MARSDVHSARSWAIVMIAGSLFAIGHTLWTGHTVAKVAIGLVIWTSVLVLVVAQYRLLSRAGFYGSALYHRLLMLTAMLVWLPFTGTFVQDLAVHRPVSPWAFLLFGLAVLTMRSGWRQYRTARTAEASKQ